MGVCETGADEIGIGDMRASQMGKYETGVVEPKRSQLARMAGQLVVSCFWNAYHEFHIR